MGRVGRSEVDSEQAKSSAADHSIRLRRWCYAAWAAHPTLHNPKAARPTLEVAARGRAALRAAALDDGSLLADGRTAGAPEGAPVFWFLI